ncbi:hypothetical protein [Agarilytica rhodophyticola]|uniref:hypothetical protein n=1 Tax=Agarilytica rhodophyticola TaxID=1737490 RepID=UPI000B343AE0|nr:hypothetical protein [Agarilytica rhodophyticola]
MAIPSTTLKVYEINRVDRTIEAFANIKNPTISGLNFVKTQGDIQSGIEQYRMGAMSMTERQRLEEKHNSSKLAEFMEAQCDPRPNTECHCHFIISGGHPTVRRLDAASVSALDFDHCVASG